MIIKRGIGTSLLQVPFKRSPSRNMQGYESILPELGGSDHQSVRCEIIVPEADCLGNAKAGAGQQSEKGTVGLLAQGAISRLRGQLNDLTDLLVGENIWSGSRPTLSAKNLGWYLMTCILSTEI